MRKVRLARIGMVVAVLLLLITSGARLGPGHLSGAQAEKPKDDNVKKLLKERLAVVLEIAKQAQTEYQTGKVSFDRVHQALLAVLNAKLELCETDKERIPILEEAVALAKSDEKTAAQLYQVAKVPFSDVLLAKASRLEAEIALERAKAKISAKSK